MRFYKQLLALLMQLSCLHGSESMFVSSLFGSHQLLIKSLFCEVQCLLGYKVHGYTFYVLVYKGEHLW